MHNILYNSKISYLLYFTFRVIYIISNNYAIFCNKYVNRWIEFSSMLMRQIKTQVTWCTYLENRHATWSPKFRILSLRLFAYEKVVSRVPDYSLSSDSSWRRSCFSVESISARYCHFMIMLSAPGSRWASAIPTPAYVRACTRNRRAVTYVYVRSQPGVSSNPGFSNLSRFMNGGSSLHVARHPPLPPAVPTDCTHFPFPRSARLLLFPMKWTCSFLSFWIFIVRTQGLNRILPRRSIELALSRSD